MPTSELRRTRSGRSPAKCVCIYISHSESSEASNGAKTSLSVSGGASDATLLHRETCGFCHRNNSINRIELYFNSCESASLYQSHFHYWMWSLYRRDERRLLKKDVELNLSLPKSPRPSPTPTSHSPLPRLDIPYSIHIPP